MGKKYIIEKFPKNKDTDTKLLSDEMKLIRSETKKCTKCKKELPITEFYFINKDTGKRNTCCRDCKMLLYDKVKEIGKTRFSIKILKKGFRRCGICKNILPVANFRKSKKSLGGYYKQQPST